MCTDEFTQRYFSKNKGTIRMAEIPTEVKDIINKFLVKLSESNITIQRAILFGSYAKKFIMNIATLI